MDEGRAGRQERTRPSEKEGHRRCTHGRLPTKAHAVAGRWVRAGGDWPLACEKAAVTAGHSPLARVGEKRLTFASPVRINFLSST